MRIKHLPLSIAYKSVIILCALSGILLQTGLFGGSFNLRMLRFFTNQSNLLVAAYFLCDVAFLLKNRNDPLAPAVWQPWLKGVAMMGVTVTWLVAHFLLGSFTMGAELAFAVKLVHYVVPIMTICDWLLFDPKGLMRAYSPLVWTVFPLAYFAYAVIGVALGFSLGYDGSRYPYPFIDVDALGWGRVLLTVVLLVVFFVALGYVFYLVDRLLQRLGDRLAAKRAHRANTQA